jgi:hypothetical protein
MKYLLSRVSCCKVDRHTTMSEATIVQHKLSGVDELFLVEFS